MTLRRDAGNPSFRRPWWRWWVSVIFCEPPRALLFHASVALCRLRGGRRGARGPGNQFSGRNYQAANPRTSGRSRTYVAVLNFDDIATIGAGAAVNFLKTICANLASARPPRAAINTPEAAA